jgi:uroporphyrinogen decarboxylase
MDMFDHPDFLEDLLAFCRDVVNRLADLYIDAGMDVIAVVDPLVSQISPRHFRKLLSAVYTDIFDHIRSRDVFSSFFVCGDATKNIEVMCKTGPDSISVDENINLPAVKKITDQYDITMGGNIPLTTRMLLGTQQDNMKFVVDLLDQIDTHNFILAPGCDMPYDVPVENTVGVVQAVRNPETTREMLKNYTAATFNVDAVELPDYDHLDNPLVEVFTLDSDTCAACGYMRDAATRAVAELPYQADLVEYKFTNKDNVSRMMKLGVKNLPSIYINGELTYSSIIPSNRELMEKISEHVKDEDKA